MINIIPRSGSPTVKEENTVLMHWAEIRVHWYFLDYIYLAILNICILSFKKALVNINAQSPVVYI